MPRSRPLIRAVNIDLFVSLFCLTLTLTTGCGKPSVPPVSRTPERTTTAITHNAQASPEEVQQVTDATLVEQTANASPTDVKDADDLSWLEKTSDGELALEKQKFIWETEHITFLLEKRFGARFKTALANRSHEELAVLFRNDASGEVFGAAEPFHDKKQGELRESVRKMSKGTPGNIIDQRALVTALVDSLVKFDTIENVGLRVLKIRQLPSKEDTRWSTEVLITAAGRDGENQLLAFDSLQNVTFAYAEKTELDGGSVVADWKMASQRIRSCSRLLMEESTEQFGLSALPLVDNWTTKRRPQQWHYQMAVEDYDNDGFLDIAIATYDGKPMLLRSVEGKRFEDQTEGSGLKPWTAGQPRYVATWIDFDNDGFHDLILGHRLYRNADGKGFVDVTEFSGLKIGMRAMGCAIADYDADGFLDIYISYQNSGKSSKSGALPWVGDSSSGQLNALWHNEGDGKFRDVTELSGTAGGLRNSLAANWIYANEDAHVDLYVANDFGPNVMLLNRGDGTFEDVSESTGLADYATSMGVASGDINNDGRPEIYVANMYSKMGRRIIAQIDSDDYPSGIYEQIKGACAGNRLYQFESESKQYKDLSTDLHVNGIGWAFAPVMTDLNNDGLLDMYATTGFMSFDRKKPDG